MRNWAPALGILWLAYLLLAFGGIGAVLSGNLPGNDDAMRLLQVRDLLSGGPWYDVSRARFVTDDGGAMHWSRIPDLGIGGLYLMARVFVSPAGAENFAVVAWPLLLSFGFGLAGFGVLSRLGVGKWFALVTMLLVTQTYTFAQFTPGRVDHHGLLVVLMLAAIWGLLGRSLWSAALSGLAVAAMLSVAIEGLPVVAGCLVGSGLLWVFKPTEQAGRLAAFGAALFIGAGLAFLLDAPGPSVAARAVCDALGNGHVSALLVGGVGFVALGRLKSLQDKPLIWRLGAVSGVGILAAIAALSATPECLADPYATLPADIQVRWLSIVGEAKPLLANSPQLIWQYAPILFFAVLGGGWLVFKAQRAEKSGWAFILGLLFITVLSSLWQTRGLTFSHVLAMLIAGGLIERYFTLWRKQGGAGALLLFAGVAFALAPFTWVSVSASFAEPAKAEAADRNAAKEQACTSRDTLQNVLGVPQARVLSTIDAGARVLLHTEHQVFAAPYHRNPSGIALAINVFSSPIEEAESKAREAGADYIFFCVGGSAEERAYANWNEKGLAARLNRGEIPAWLKIERSDDSGATLYRILPTP